MVLVYQNKIQFICYEEGTSDDLLKYGYSKGSQPKLPLANDFTFEKVAGETQTSNNKRLQPCYTYGV